MAVVKRFGVGGMRKWVMSKKKVLLVGPSAVLLDLKDSFGIARVGTPSDFLAVS